MKVAVVGASGQLGTDIVREFAAAGHEMMALTHDDIDITRWAIVEEVIGRLRPELIINTAAYHRFEYCESNPETAFAVNALGARNIAIAAGRLGAAVMQLSTDYVFDGLKGAQYDESDVARPLNVYGNSKLAGEHFTMAEVVRHFIVRVSALYGHAPCRGKGRNFVDLMISLARKNGVVSVVDDEIVSPTSTRSVARQLVMLANSDEYGLYHATAQGECSWYGFAQEILRLVCPAAQVQRRERNTPEPGAKRPPYSVLHNARLGTLGLDIMPPWQEGLEEYLAPLL